MATAAPIYRPPSATAPTVVVTVAPADNRPGSQWYRTERWKRASKAFRIRHPICALCQRAASEEVDHVKPHKGDYAVFWDESNWQAVCTPCHSTKTATEDGGFGNRSATVAAITVVAGPPGSGKTSWAHEHKSEGDIVVDLDTIAAALCGLPLYQRPPRILDYAMRARDGIINGLIIANPRPKAWIVGGYPLARERQWLRDRLQARVIVLEVPEAECLRRIDLQADRCNRMGGWADAVGAWWKNYQPLEADDRRVWTP